MNPDNINRLIADLQAADISDRKNAVRELTRLRSIDAVDDLLALLHRQTDRNLRGLVIKALGKIGDSRAIQPLAELIEDPRDRPSVMNSLLRLGVFDGLLPESRRERRHFTMALQLAKPEIKQLILDGTLCQESLRSLLPPIM